MFYCFVVKLILKDSTLTQNGVKFSRLVCGQMEPKNLSSKVCHFYKQMVLHMILRPRVRNEVGVQFIGLYGILRKQVLSKESSAFVYENNLPKRQLAIFTLNALRWRILGLASSPWLLQLHSTTLSGGTLVVDSIHAMCLYRGKLYICTYVLPQRVIKSLIAPCCTNIAML